MSNFQTYTFPDKEEKASTTRPAQSALLLLDSKDRYNFKGDAYQIDNPTSPNNFLINPQRTLGAGLIKRIAVTEFSFPWSTPNINETNNILTIIDNDTLVEYYIVVPEAFYKPSELADEVVTQMNAGWIRQDGVIQPSYNAPWNCIVNPKTNAFILTSSPTGTQWTVQGDPLSSLMGLSLKQSFLNPPSAPTSYVVVGGIPSMSYTSYIDVCSKALTKYQNLKDTLTQLNYSDIICRIYLENSVNGPTDDGGYFGSRPCINLSKQIVNPKYMLWNETEMLTTIDIQLYDERGQLLYIPESNWNLDFFLTLQMSES